MKKFTFKTDRATGAYSSFFKPTHHIKLNKIICGSIDSEKPHKIRLQVNKKDINEDGNPNCKWKWVRLRKESQSLQEAKDFLNENFDNILSVCDIYLSD